MDVVFDACGHTVGKSKQEGVQCAGNHVNGPRSICLTPLFYIPYVCSA